MYGHASGSQTHQRLILFLTSGQRVHFSKELFLPLSASVVDGQLFRDALLRFKSVPVHLGLLQRAHLLFLSPDATQDARHARWPFAAANTTEASVQESHIPQQTRLFGRLITACDLSSNEPNRIYSNVSKQLNTC